MPKRYQNIIKFLRSVIIKISISCQDFKIAYKIKDVKGRFLLYLWKKTNNKETSFFYLHIFRAFTNFKKVKILLVKCICLKQHTYGKINISALSLIFIGINFIKFMRNVICIIFINALSLLLVFDERIFV